MARLQTRHQNQLLTPPAACTPRPATHSRCSLEIEYHVGRDGLTVTTTGAIARGDRSIPSASASTPTSPPGAETVDGAILHVPARHTLEMDDRGLPTGALSPVEGTERDFTTARFVGARRCSTPPTPPCERDADGLARATLDAPGGVGGAALWVDAGFPYLMVYTGDTLGEVQRRRRGVAIEPMTCPPNALRTGTDVIVLQPGHEWTARWGIEPR